MQTHLGLAVALAVLAALVWLRRKGLTEPAAAPADGLRAFDLLTRPRFAFGTACLFLYVGAEVSIGSLIVSYLTQTSALGISAVEAGRHVPFYWGGAMVGRFIGAYVLRLVSPGTVLAGAAAIVIGLLILSANSAGAVSGWSLLSVGLFSASWPSAGMPIARPQAPRRRVGTAGSEKDD